MEGGRKEGNKKGRIEEREVGGILLFIYNPNVGEKQVDT